MARDYLLLENMVGGRSNPKPDGTRIIADGDSLEEIIDALEAKTGRDTTEDVLDIDAFDLDLEQRDRRRNGGRR